MNYSIKKELQEDFLERLHEYIDSKSDEKIEINDLHHEMYNMDYYIIGYYQSEQWLKEHNVSVFEGINFCIEQENENFGESNTDFKNSETLVNHIVYWVSQEIIYDSLSGLDKFSQSKIYSMFNCEENK